MRIRRLPSLVLAAAIGVAALQGWTQWRLHWDWLYIEGTILEDGVVARWTESVEVYVGDSMAADFPVVAEAVDLINALLLGTGIRLLGPVPDPHTLLPPRYLAVSALPRADFEALPENAQGPGTVGLTAVALNGYALRSAGIRVRGDLEGDERRHTIWHEIAHAIGLTGHASVYRVSAVSIYGRFDIKFAAIDRKAVRFLYRHLQPGDGPELVRRAFDAHWRTIPGD